MNIESTVMNPSNELPKKDEVIEYLIDHAYTEALRKYKLCRQSLASLIGCTDIRQRMAFEMRQNGMTYHQIADRMKIEIATAREYVSRYSVKTLGKQKPNYHRQAKKKPTGRSCRSCGCNPYPNYFYCQKCHARLSR